MQTLTRLNSLIPGDVFIVDYIRAYGHIEGGFIGANNGNLSVGLLRKTAHGLNGHSSLETNFTF